MKYIIYIFIGLLVLLFIIWQIAGGLITLAIATIKILLVLGSIVFFWLGWKARGFLEKYRKGRAVEYFATRENKA